MADHGGPRRAWRLHRLASTTMLTLALVAACSGGSEEELADLEDQAAHADEALRGVGEGLDGLGGTTTGPGRAGYGTCGVSPSTRVSYEAKVTYRAVAASDEEILAEASSVLEELGWTVEPATSSGLRAERGGASARLSIGPAATAFSVQSECVGVPDPDEVTDRPEKTFGLG